MRVFLVNPPLHDLHFSRPQRSPGVIKSGTMYYPYWLAHAAALLEKNGHEIFLLDCPADGISRNDLLRQITNFSPDMVVVESSTPSFNYDQKTVSFLKKNHNCKYVMTGTHSTIEWEITLLENRQLDFVAIGEYDFTLLELANCLANKDDPADVAGLAFLHNNKPIQTAVRLPIENMDKLPWISPIYKRFLNINNYLFTIATHPMVMLIGGRGCKAKCFYCVYPQVMHGHAYRTRSPEHLVGEMKWIQENMPEINEIVFEDDTFTSDRKWAKEVARQIQEQGVTLPWFANIRTNTDYETLTALKSAGLRECATGFESADNTILLNMRKGQDTNSQFTFMKNCKKLKLLVHGCFMVGFPGETKETMEKTLQLAIKLNPDSAQFYPVMPYPGTGAYQWAHDNDYLDTHNFDEWLTKSGGHKCVLSLPGLSSQQLEDFCEYALKHFHFRTSYIAKKLLQAIKNPAEGIRSINAGINFIKHLIKGEKKLQHKTNTRINPNITKENWHRRIKVPFGRMELINNAVKESQKHNLSNKEMNIQLVSAESKALRKRIL